MWDSHFWLSAVSTPAQCDPYRRHPEQAALFALLCHPEPARAFCERCEGPAFLFAANVAPWLEPGSSLALLYSPLTVFSEPPEVDRRPAPLLGSYIGDRLGKGPAMAREVLGIVLTLPVRVVDRTREDAGASLPRSLAVTRRISHAHHNQVPAIRRHLPIRHHQASVARLKLDAVVANAQPGRERSC
jgi:hypothetical protein